MGKPVKEFTPGSNLAAMSPEKRARWEALISDEFGQILVDGLNKGMERDYERRKREEQQRREQAGASSQDPESRGNASD